MVLLLKMGSTGEYFFVGCFSITVVQLLRCRPRDGLRLTRRWHSCGSEEGWSAQGRRKRGSALETMRLALKYEIGDLRKRLNASYTSTSGLWLFVSYHYALFSLSDYSVNLVIIVFFLK